MSELAPRERAAAATVLLAGRAAYAFNWYNIGAFPTPIERSFGIGTVEFGVVLASFLLGAAVFQLPAGFAALRFGNRPVSVAALGVMGAFCLASGFSPSWPVLAALRFGAGVGAAFFFAPALGLIAGYYPEGRRGPVIGLYNGLFAIGSALGLVGGALVAERYGWPAALELGGALLLAVVPAAVVGLPHRGDLRPTTSWRSVARASGPVARSRRLWALTLSGTGLWAGYFIAAQYFVEYAASAHPVWSLAEAAAVPTAMIFAQALGGPLGGWFAERSGDMRRWFLVWGAIAAGVLGVVPVLSFELVGPAFVLLGSCAGVTFAVLYLVPTYLPELRGARYSFAVATINAVQIFLGSALALLFALVASDAGFALAWGFAAVVSLGFLPALYFLGPVRRPPAATTGAVPLGETARRSG